MQGCFSGLDLFVLLAVAIALENSVPAALVMVAPQELGDFEFDGYLQHELGTQADGFGERSPSGGRAEELSFEGLAGKLAFHDVYRFLFYRRSWSLHAIGFYRKSRTSPRSSRQGCIKLIILNGTAAMRTVWVLIFQGVIG
jgi:hypothetical protein